MRFLSGMRCALVLVAFSALGHDARGQELPQSSATAPLAEVPLTAERIEALRKEADESSELDDEAKKKVTEIYRSALAEWQRAGELGGRATAFQTDAEGTGQRVARIKQQLDELKGKEPALPEGETLAELEQARSKLELQLAAQKQAQTAAEAEPKLRAQRRKEIRARLVAIPERLAELIKQSESLPTDEPALLNTARRTEMAARRLAFESEIPALENELAKYDAEEVADLVRLQRDLCTQEVALAERNLNLLKEQIKKAQAVAAEEAVRKARDEAIAADPVLESYAERNRNLAEVAKSITEQFDAADADLKTAREVHDQLLRQFEQTCKKVESVGLTSSIGALLRKQRASLPDVRKRRAAVGNRRKTIDDTQYELFEYDDERQELANPDLLVQSIMVNADARGAHEPEML